MRLPTKTARKEVFALSKDANSLAHTRWNCKYHLVFTPKYQRRVIYGQLRADIGHILRRLCELKDVEIIEAHTMPDHIHMLVKIPSKISVASFMGYLKGRSAVIIDKRHANLKYKYGNCSFLAQQDADRKRKHDGRKTVLDDPLNKLIENRLSLTWSLEAIATQFKLATASIYNWLHKYKLNFYFKDLPDRNRRRQRSKETRGQYLTGSSIEQRPTTVNQR